MGRRYAVCVGINEYRNSPTHNLTFAKSDAEEVARLLRSPVRGGFDGVQCLVDQDASKQHIKEVLDDVLNSQLMQPEDLIVFYFSGHGIRDKEGDLCLVPHDFELQKSGGVAISTTLHSKEIEILLSNSAARNVVLLIDCCHSGALGESLRRIRFSERSNIFVVGASLASQPAYEQHDIQHGVFTNCLLRAFQLSPDHGEWITLGKILPFLSDSLKNLSSIQVFQTSATYVDLSIALTRNPSFSTHSSDFTGVVARTFGLANYQITKRPSLEDPTFFIAGLKAGYDVTHTAVLCLDNTDTQLTTDDIDDFITQIRQLYADHQVSKGRLVTSTPLPTQLQRRIRRHPFAETCTNDELLRNSIDLDQYLARLIREFDQDNVDRPGEPALGRFYINIQGETRNDTTATGIHDVVEFVRTWTTKRGRTKLALLGDYGLGKTTLCRKIARDLAEKYLLSTDKQNRRIPLIIPLRDFPKGRADIEVFIAGFLARRCGVTNPSYDALKAMNDAGLLLLILDGFDEMAVHADEDTIYANIAQIDHLAMSGKSKVLLTTRPEYFTNSLEQKQALAPDSILPHRRQYEMLHLRPFSDMQVKDFLRRRIPLIDTTRGWEFYFAEISRIHDLTDLSRRPVLLEMIVKTLPKLISTSTTSRPIDRPLLYRTYIDGELQRQAVEKQRELLIKRKDRFNMMQTLALHLYNEGISGVKADAIQNLVERQLTAKQREELDAHTRDFLTCSFLVRQGDIYSFSHRSFLEYLAARALFDEIVNGTPLSFSRRPLTKDVMDFIREMEPNRNTLITWIGRSKFGKPDAVNYLDANSLSLLVSLSDECRGVDLTGCYFKGGYFVGATFRECKAVKSNFSHSNMAKCTFLRCDFEGADFTGTSLTDVHCEDTSFDMANLVNADFTGTRCWRVRFDNAKCKATNYSRVVVEDCSFRNFDRNGVLNASVSLSRKIVPLTGSWVEEERGRTFQWKCWITSHNDDKIRGMLQIGPDHIVSLAGKCIEDKYTIIGRDKKSRRGGRQKDKHQEMKGWIDVLADGSDGLLISLSGSKNSSSSKARRFRRGHYTPEELHERFGYE